MRILKRNDAEAVGVLVAAGLAVSTAPEPGTEAWAAQLATEERYGSVERFADILEKADSRAAVQGYVNQIKGRAAEHIVAWDEGGTVHDAWNVPDTDVFGSNGERIQVKTGEPSYIREALQDRPRGVEFHTGLEGEGIDGVDEVHDFSADRLEQCILDADDTDVDELDVLIPGIGAGTVLAGLQTLEGVRSGAIRLSDAPKSFVVNTGKKSVRVWLVGTAMSTGNVVLVSGAVGYLLYRNRKAMGIVLQKGWGVLKNKTLHKAAKGTAYYTTIGTREVAKGLFRAATHPTTKKAAGTTAKLAAKGTGKVLKESGKLGLKGGKRIINWLFKKS